MRLHKIDKIKLDIKNAKVELEVLDQNNFYEKNLFTIYFKLNHFFPLEIVKIIMTNYYDDFENFF